MTITDQIRDILRASNGPLTVQEIHKLLPAKTLLSSVDALCWQRRRAGEFMRESIGTRAGYRINPNFKGQALSAPARETNVEPSPAGASPQPVEPAARPAASTPNQVGARPRVRQVRVRPFIPAQPEIMVFPCGPEGVCIQAHDPNGEEGSATDLISFERTEIPALIRALASFSDAPMEKILAPEAV